MRILGISGAFGHDAAAALVDDGRIVAACEEERFTRQKRALRQPAEHSVQACLDEGGVDLDEIDCIAIGWDPALAPGDSRLTASLQAFLTSNRIANARSVPPLVHVGHHRAHAALAYLTSGFADAAVVVADGQGETESTTVYVARGSQLKQILSLPIRDSLGFFFAAVTRYLGFSPGSAGKVMGLAALGQATDELPEIVLDPGGLEVRVVGVDKSERMASWLQLLERRFGPRGDRRFRMDAYSGLLQAGPALEPHHRNAAASAQAALERAVLHLCRVALARSGGTNLVLGGGVALNCAANGRIRDALSGVGLHVHGAAHDGGTALGAALAVAAERTPARLQAAREDSRFLGPRLATGTAIDMARRLGLRIDAGPDGSAYSAARRVAAGEVGAWFHGRAEYGPRALGARSIVARADQREVARRVNEIKGREPWRPLAPAITVALCERLKLDAAGLDAMVEARWLSPGCDTAPAEGVVHVDGSLRPLVVAGPSEPFYPLLDALEREAGLHTVINTSLNLEHEPIAHSPGDALRTFVSSELDFLALEEALIVRPFKQ